MHAINFGAGGISGIGPLTAQNLDGCGVRIIVTTIPVAPPLPADPRSARSHGEVNSDGSDFVASGGTQMLM